jgi:hypothetical protein
MKRKVEARIEQGEKSSSEQFHQLQKVKDMSRPQGEPAGRERFSLCSMQGMARMF